MSPSIRRVTLIALPIALTAMFAAFWHFERQPYSIECQHPSEMKFFYTFDPGAAKVMHESLFLRQLRGSIQSIEGRVTKFRIEDQGSKIILSWNAGKK